MSFLGLSVFSFTLVFPLRNLFGCTVHKSCLDSWYMCMSICLFLLGISRPRPLLVCKAFTVISLGSLMPKQALRQSFWGVCSLATAPTGPLSIITGQYSMHGRTIVMYREIAVFSSVACLTFLNCETFDLTIPITFCSWGPRVRYLSMVIPK